MVVDKVADAFLETMMELFMKSQGIPAVIEITSDVHNQTHQDFPAGENFDKIDFQRAFYHTRTEIDTILSLDEFQENDNDMWESAQSVFELTDDEIDPVAEDKKCIFKKDIIIIDGADKIADELRRIGNNINQLTRAANAGIISVVDLRETRKELAELWQLLNSLQ